MRSSEQSSMGWDNGNVPQKVALNRGYSNGVSSGSERRVPLPPWKVCGGSIGNAVYVGDFITALKHRFCTT